VFSKKFSPKAFINEKHSSSSTVKSATQKDAYRRKMHHIKVIEKKNAKISPNISNNRRFCQEVIACDRFIFVFRICSGKVTLIKISDFYGKTFHFLRGDPEQKVP
jgi:hypothetical protein